VDDAPRPTALRQDDHRVTRTLTGQNTVTITELRSIRFNSAISKVKRACEHIGNIEKTLGAIHEASAHALTIKGHFDGTKTSVEVAIDWAPFLARVDLLRVMTGDAVHNLRSALDHLAYGIVSAFEDPPNYLYFPIDGDLNSLRAQRSFRIIERLAPDIADLIVREIKPYGDGNLFVSLNHLDRADKHRFLLTHTGTGNIHVYVSANDDDVPDKAVDCLVLIKDDPHSEALRVPRPGTASAAHNDQYRRATFDVVFDKGLPFEHEPIVPTMRHLSQLVARAINVLAAHCSGVDMR
jgi:hypothetical protein